MDFKEDLSRDMMRMLANGSTNDVKIILDDGEIRAHREILALRCEYFAATFRWSEGNNQEGSGDIKIQDCSKEVMERVIEFLFSGVKRFKDLGLLQLLELVNQVRKLMLKDDMRLKIEDYIRDDVICMAKWERGEDGVSCLDLIIGVKNAENLNLDEIKRSLTKEIGENFITFMMKEGGAGAYTKLPFGLLKEILLNCKEKIDTERRKELNSWLFGCFWVWYGNVWYGVSFTPADSNDDPPPTLQAPRPVTRRRWMSSSLMTARRKPRTLPALLSWRKSTGISEMILNPSSEPRSPSSLPSLTLSCYISGYWGPALHSLGSSLPPAIDIVEDYLREARRHATHVPQEESLKVTIEDEDIHDLLVNSNDTTETLDDRG